MYTFVADTNTSNESFCSSNFLDLQGVYSMYTNYNNDISVNCENITDIKHLKSETYNEINYFIKLYKYIYFKKSTRVAIFCV